MRLVLPLTLGLCLGLFAPAGDVAAQMMMYPGGYGGYGMSRWGADPAAGYMAGLGAYARGQGVYQLEKAKADAINVDTMVKWNKALRARQAALRDQKRKEDAERQAEAATRVAQRSLADGTTLNDLLYQILDSDPIAARSRRANAPLSAAAIREIPFEWDSEAITICVDQMTGSDSLPGPLMDSRYDAERRALRAAVAPALAEDARGDVSPATRKRVVDAVAALQASFKKNASELDPGYQEAKDFLTTLAGLSRLLNDPSMKAFLSKVEDGKDRTVGQLIAFMHAFNLRFGPATSERQIDLYRSLVPELRRILDAASAGTAAAPDRSGEGLRAAARAVFKGMNWDELEAHSRNH